MIKKLTKKEIKNIAEIVYNKLEEEQYKEIEEDKTLLDKKYRLILQQLTMNELSVARPEAYELIVSLAKKSLELYSKNEDDSKERNELTENYEKFITPIIEVIHKMF